MGASCQLQQQHLLPCWGLRLRLVVVAEHCVPLTLHLLFSLILSLNLLWMLCGMCPCMYLVMGFSLCRDWACSTTQLKTLQSWSALKTYYRFLRYQSMVNQLRKEISSQLSPMVHQLRNEISSQLENHSKEAVVRESSDWSSRLISLKYSAKNPDCDSAKYSLSVSPTKMQSGESSASAIESSGMGISNHMHGF